MRLLFCSIHSYLDPSSGAALCTNELLEPLAARGMDCRVLCAGVFDVEQETSLDEVLSGSRPQAGLNGGRSAGIIDLSLNGVRITLMPTAPSRAERSPDQQEGAVCLDPAKQVLNRFRPELETVTETETGTQLDEPWNRGKGCVAVSAPRPRFRSRIRPV